MEHFVELHIEKLPEGGFLATSDDVQGLVLQGSTLRETIRNSAWTLARKLIEAKSAASPITARPR